MGSLRAHLIAILGVVNSIKASTIPSDHGPPEVAKRQAVITNTWPYGVIGDSWASGVSYNTHVLYDNNSDFCLRTTESHGPQLAANTSWLGSTLIPGLSEAACSGSRLIDLASALGQFQIHNVSNPDVIVMTSGGNNCFFADIVDNCIYHSDPTKKYGPAYADDVGRSGSCAQSLKQAEAYIFDALQNDMNITINDILADPVTETNPNFLLYVTGYAQFFGTDFDPWCNNEAWNIPGISPTPYLSQELRTTFNDLVSQINNLYKSIVNNFHSTKARYIDLDAGFSGHRFCEPGANHADQFNTDSDFTGVYLWNLNWPWQVAAPLSETSSTNVTIENAASIMGSDGVTAWGSGGGEVNVPENGWKLRPFHPRYTGYTSIKNAIIAQLKTDGFPKTTSP
ncbi:hypothetical protein P7C71_g3919, partial [Lecanoromycetidae sp. Uapishka_2]